MNRRSFLKTTFGVIAASVFAPSVVARAIEPREVTKPLSAIHRVDVRNILEQIRKQTEDIAETFLFEHNNEVTRYRLETSLNHSLQQFVSKGHVNQLQVSCSGVNNPVDDSMLHIDVYVQPTRNLEYIAMHTQIG